MKKFFQSNDELRAVNPEWSVEKMRAQKGLFFLAEVQRKLGLSEKWIKDILAAFGDRPDVLMRHYGIRRVFHRNLVHMDILAAYLNAFDARFMTHEIPSNWTSDQLFDSTYVYRLGDVARVLKKTSRTLMSVHKHAQLEEPSLRKRDIGLHAHYNGGWVVDMAKFASFYRAYVSAGGRSQRPKVYVGVVQALDDDVLYSPGMIAARAVEDKAGEDRDRGYARVYAVMMSYARRHQFPKGGDGKLDDGNAAWKGRRWKATYGNEW